VNVFREHLATMAESVFVPQPKADAWNQGERHPARYTGGYLFPDTQIVKVAIDRHTLV
jgi:hypothetical protein